MVHALVLRIEDLLQRFVLRRMRRRGRPVEIRPFSGFGAGDSVRVGGRVVASAEQRPVGGSAEPTGTWQVLRANLSQFITLEVPYAHVRVEVGGCTTVVSADREGYVDAELSDVPLTPGRHTATLTPLDPAGAPATTTVHVANRGADLAIVSDIDDTIIDSGIAHGLVATIATALLRSSATRVPLDGAPELYQALARGAASDPQRPFFYLSTSPWNLAAFLSRFLTQHGFPAGPLLLTDWGPGSAGVFRIATRAHKLTALRRLAERLPDQRFVLLGDSGQEDVEIYTAFALEFPGRVAAVYIRRAGTAPAVKRRRLDACARTLADAGIPYVLAVDSTSMLRHARRIGVAA